MSGKGDESSQPWEKKKQQPQSLHHFCKWISLSESALINSGEEKNLSDEKFLTPLSTGNLFHEVWPRVSLQPKLQKAEISKSGKINFWVKEWLKP